MSITVSEARKSLFPLIKKVNDRFGGCVRLVFEDQGWEDYTSWLKNDRKMLARLNKLIEDVRRDPSQNR